VGEGEGEGASVAEGVLNNFTAPHHTRHVMKGYPMKVREGDIFRSFLSDEEYVIKKIVKNTAVLESQNGKKQVLTDVDNLKIRSFYKKKEG
jgi:hypothetical protein